MASMPVTAVAADSTTVITDESQVRVIDSETKNDVSHFVQILTKRRYVKNDKALNLTISNSHKFSVVSYNILAECHMIKLGTDIYPDLAKEELQQEFRHKLLIQELQHLNADIICLQECGVDYYNQTLEPALKELGYGGQFMKRLNERHPEGEATFYRLTTFTLVTTTATAINDICDQAISTSELDDATKACLKPYLDTSEIILITKLRSNRTMNELTVGNVHIQWTFYKKLDLQCVQVSCALNELMKAARGSKAYILTGDFNSLPTMAPYLLTRDAVINEETKQKLEQIKNITVDGTSQSLVSLWPQGFRHTAPGLRSVYATVRGREPEATTVDVCGPTPGECVDYIFYSPEGIIPLGVLDCHTESELQKIMPLPNQVYPSDHVSITADFAFV